MLQQQHDRPSEGRLIDQRRGPKQATGEGFTAVRQPAAGPCHGSIVSHAGAGAHLVLRYLSGCVMRVVVPVVMRYVTGFVMRSVVSPVTLMATGRPDTPWGIFLQAIVVAAVRTT